MSELFDRLLETQATNQRDARIRELEAKVANWRKIADELAKALDAGTCAMSYMQDIDEAEAALDAYNKAKAEAGR